ncbi:alcohol dehydrogenase [Fusarium napiforme]|uniref:Alcohol dehydrogenase n=1 Tax=Fusarium napiforme TaxID=42672 RepID=A0A8H5IQL7_9HYPO|nr:alcohol dehydrogenase [Fusarium napiforme]
MLHPSELRTVLNHMEKMPDGITIDHQNGFMYWTNMGPTFKSNGGSIERSRLDGSERTTVVMRCHLGRSNVEVRVSSGSTADDRKEMCRWCVGITVDESNGNSNWAQKGPSKEFQGHILRAKIDDPTHIETVFDNLPETIDLEFDESTQTLYWTDGGDPPPGNSLNRAFIGDLSSEPERDGLVRGFIYCQPEDEDKDKDSAVCWYRIGVKNGSMIKANRPSTNRNAHVDQL